MVTPAPDRVRRALADAPISLRSLADEAGVDPSVVRKAAIGERTLSPTVARALAAALDRTAASATASARVLRAFAATQAKQ
jgi:transcriptional regulator with XRE-family HTH domain